MIGYRKFWMPVHIYITACGTSWHAALIGSYILEELLNVPVKVEYASEFRYKETAVNGDSVVICVSQSGETADTLAAIKKGKRKGSPYFGNCQCGGQQYCPGNTLWCVYSCWTGNWCGIHKSLYGSGYYFQSNWYFTELRKKVMIQK